MLQHTTQRTTASGRVGRLFKHHQLPALIKAHHTTPMQTIYWRKPYNNTNHQQLGGHAVNAVELVGTLLLHMRLPVMTEDY